MHWFATLEYLSSEIQKSHAVKSSSKSPILGWRINFTQFFTKPVACSRVKEIFGFGMVCIQRHLYSSSQSNALPWAGIHSTGPGCSTLTERPQLQTCYPKNLTKLHGDRLDVDWGLPDTSLKKAFSNSAVPGHYVYVLERSQNSNRLFVTHSKSPAPCYFFISSTCIYTTKPLWLHKPNTPALDQLNPYPLPKEKNCLFL